MFEIGAGGLSWAKVLKTGHDGPHLAFWTRFLVAVMRADSGFNLMLSLGKASRPMPAILFALCAAFFRLNIRLDTRIILNFRQNLFLPLKGFIQKRTWMDHISFLVFALQWCFLWALRHACDGKRKRLRFHYAEEAIWRAISQWKIGEEIDCISSA